MSEFWFRKTPAERELEMLRHRLDKLEKRVSSLGASVPPGSESALRGTCDKPPLPSRADSEIPERGERLSETLARVFQLWNTARGELDAANQHVKILEADRSAAIAACLRSCAQTISENRMLGPAAADYLRQYANTVIRQASGPPTPGLAAQRDSNLKEAERLIPIWVREYVQLYVQEQIDQRLGASVPPGSESALRGDCVCRHGFKVYGCLLTGRAYLEPGTVVAPAGGPPTPDLAAQPDSNTEPCIEEAYQAINRLHRIGVYDYASCVSCLRTNYKLVFGDDAPLTDPQDMIQRLAAEIQELRRMLRSQV